MLTSAGAAEGEGGVALDFNAVSLTPLTGDNIRALQSLTSGWSRPDGAGGISARTLGPETYRRRRRRNATIAATLLGSIVMFVPVLGMTIAYFGDDRASLAGGIQALPYFGIGAIVFGTIGAAISWYQTSGKGRTTAGAEPETQLTFRATAEALEVSNGAGARIAAPWPRWRIAHVRSQMHHLKSGQLHVLDRIDLVILGEDGGAHAGSVTLDPDTLSDGRSFGGTAIAMIAAARGSGSN